MSKDEIYNGLKAINSAVTFIANYVEKGDETGICDEMVSDLYELKEALERESDRVYKKRVSAKARQLFKKKLRNG